MILDYWQNLNNYQQQFTAAWSDERDYMGNVNALFADVTRFERITENNSLRRKIRSEVGSVIEDDSLTELKKYQRILDKLNNIDVGAAQKSRATKMLLCLINKTQQLILQEYQLIAKTELQPASVSVANMAHAVLSPLPQVEELEGKAESDSDDDSEPGAPERKQCG